MSKKLKIYYTTDTHGYVFKTDYLTAEEKNMGLLSVVNNFKKDSNTLIIDAGDTIQGSAFLKYCRQNEFKTKPIADILNNALYDIVVPGNHDFNYGYDEFKNYFENLNAICLGANIKDKTKGLNIDNYCIKKMENGLTVGIVGVVTNYVNVWESEENLKNFEISDAFISAKNALDEIKKLCDFTICIYHGGFEEALDSLEYNTESGIENQGLKICKELNFDLLLTGHQHMNIPLTNINGTHTMQLMFNATMYGEIDVKFDDNNKFVSCSGYNQLPTNQYDKDMYDSLYHIEKEVQNYLDLPVCTLNEQVPPLQKLDIALNGSRIADFANQIMMHYTNAQISCTSLGNEIMSLPKELTIRNIMATFPFPNDIYVIKVKGNTIKKALEKTAEYFEIKNGEVKISDEFIKLKIQHFNYDFFAGIEYTFDLRNQIGDRVVRLEIDSMPLDMEKYYTLAINNYRASGGGGYEFYRDCEIIKLLGADIQELAIEYAQKNKDIEIMQKPDFKCIIK